MTVLRLQIAVITTVAPEQEVALRGLRSLVAEIVCPDSLATGIVYRAASVHIIISVYGIVRTAGSRMVSLILVNNAVERQLIRSGVRVKVALKKQSALVVQVVKIVALHVLALVHLAVKIQRLLLAADAIAEATLNTEDAQAMCIIQFRPLLQTLQLALLVLRMALLGGTSRAPNVL